MPITTTDTLPPAVQQAFNYKILATPTPNYIHSTMALKKTRKKNSGNTEIFRTYDELDSSLVPLDNLGTEPPAQLLTAVDIQARIQFYGSFIEINEQVN